MGALRNVARVRRPAARISVVLYEPGHFGRGLQAEVRCRGWREALRAARLLRELAGHDALTLILGEDAWHDARPHGPHTAWLAAARAVRVWVREVWVMREECACAPETDVAAAVVCMFHAAVPR